MKRQITKNSKPRHASLPPEKLRWRCSPEGIPFETTAEIAPVSSDFGQERALRALRMGVEMTASGYNLFVCGLSGMSRGGMMVRLIEEMRSQSEAAPDRCYVNNFKNADRPRLLTLPRGQANVFKKEVESGIDFLRRRIPQVFEG
ncbi:MAG: Lon-like protease helical domain-containing protein, partial [Deltaproteobacteria bacterium]